ncbi:TetR family transcriptional regulator [Actinokineospora sp. NBRC 105648]|uniref:TetR/AcrR family transcriptional regulator n=1 Tax=Actinokineospora sp. NBRC 105648 TaxID=3032206 RepID=UPI0024A504A7|nr:TetR family transcriptional regulator [Actinokineospora sp. NBRC 105648]GLZ39422.1 TetR family transcriptional regulator [Actinokineospora sp. NBRC 105648]
MAKTGRRPGPTETRAHILAAARAQFGAHGYDGATIRGIAGEAGVNPSLVHHFFGSKDQVFAAALDFPVDPGALVATILAGPRAQVGERLLRMFLALWGAPEPSKAFLALIRSVSTNEQAADLLRQFLERAVLGRVTEALGVPRLRATALAAHLVGLAMVRYVVRVEPLASAPDEELIAVVAPVLQHYLEG